MQGEIRYARSGGVNIAYEVTGDGPLDLVLVPGFVSHMELDWQEPRYARFLERLGSFARLIRFDKRGTGLSDRPSALGGVETRMDDVRAVMDAADSDRAALFAFWEGWVPSRPSSRRRIRSAPRRSCCSAPSRVARAARLSVASTPRRADRSRRAARRGVGDRRDDVARVVRAGADGTPSAVDRARSSRGDTGLDPRSDHEQRRHRRPTRPAGHPGADARAPARGIRGRGDVHRGGYPASPHADDARCAVPPVARAGRGRRGRGVPHRRATGAAGGSRSRDDSVHRSRRVDGARPRARRRGLGGAARAASRDRPPGASRGFTARRSIPQGTAARSTAGAPSTVRSRSARSSESSAWTCGQACIRAR